MLCIQHIIKMMVVLLNPVHLGILHWDTSSINLSSTGVSICVILRDEEFLFKILCKELTNLEWRGLSGIKWKRGRAGNHFK